MSADELEDKLVNRLIYLGNEARVSGFNGRFTLIKEMITEVKAANGKSVWNRNHECGPFCEICKHEGDPVIEEKSQYE